MADQDVRLERFLALSATVTGFAQIRLRGTGQAEDYLTTVTATVGSETTDELLDAFERVADHDGGEDALEHGLRTRILSDPKLGPVVRNIIKLWYVGIWHELPSEWHDAHEAGAADRTHVVSPTAYTEGLLWAAVGANPSGAKPFGYGTWAAPPRVDTSATPEGRP